MPRQDPIKLEILRKRIDALIPDPPREIRLRRLRDLYRSEHGERLGKSLLDSIVAGLESAGDVIVRRSLSDPVGEFLSIPGSRES